MTTQCPYPQCGQSIEFTEEHLGLEVACPQCGELFLIPDQGTASSQIAKRPNGRKREQLEREGKREVRKITGIQRVGMFFLYWISAIIGTSIVGALFMKGGLQAGLLLGLVVGIPVAILQARKFGK